jgi:transcriptional regulator with XRE-family HTH domain
MPLAKLRANAGLSQTSASVKLGIGITTLVRYESGTTDLSMGTAEQMAALYGVPFDEVRAAVAKTQAAQAKEAQ